MKAAGPVGAPEQPAGQVRVPGPACASGCRGERWLFWDKRRCRDFFKEASGEGGKSSSSHKGQREGGSGSLLGNAAPQGRWGPGLPGQACRTETWLWASVGQQGACRSRAGGRRGLGLRARYRARMQGQEAAFLRGPEALGHPVQVQRQECKGEGAPGGGSLGPWRG